MILKFFKIMKKDKPARLKFLTQIAVCTNMALALVACLLLLIKLLSTVEFNNELMPYAIITMFIMPGLLGVRLMIPSVIKLINKLNGSV